MLRIPSDMKIVTMAPAAETLDPFNEASESLLGKTIIMRSEHFGWCIGKLEVAQQGPSFYERGQQGELHGHVRR